MQDTNIGARSVVGAGAGNRRRSSASSGLRGAWLAALSMLLAVSASAQTDPRTLPLVQPADVSLVGTWQIPPDDGRGILLTYGGAAGVSEDGKSLYWSCVYGSGIARLNIPAIGGTATVLEPCQGMQTFLNKITPIDPNPDVIGGILHQGGRLTVSGYNTYDGDHEQKLSHGVGATLADITQPYQLANVPNNKMGIVNGWMVPVPQEWRTLLGGPALTGHSGISIIGQSSHGPAAYVFDPAGVGPTPYQGKLLLGYPEGATNLTLGDYGNPGPGFSGATRFAGMAFPAGTRSLLFFGRHGLRPSDYCYGTGWPDPAMHRKPVPGTKHIYCYDPTNGDQGTHGYPYEHKVWAYDVNDLLAVKAGTRTPQSVLPYAMFRLPGTSDSAVVNTGAYNAVTGEFYLHDVQSALTVRVYKVGVGAPPPPPVPVDCVGTWGAWSRVAGSETACVASRRDYTESRTFTVTTPASGGGKACPASPETRTASEDCGMPPPPPPPPVTRVDITGTILTCAVRLSANQPPDAEAGWGVQFQRRAAGSADVWRNHGTRDANGADGWARGPYTVPRGEWEARGVWTRAGVTVQVNATAVYRCEE